MAQRQITGTWQLANGSPLALGYLKVRLSTDAAVLGVGGDQITAGKIVTVNLDSSGTISGTILFWPNDQLTPTNTVYIIQAFSASGQKCWQSEVMIPSGAGSFSLNG
jgi:hypothetical protein